MLSQLMKRELIQLDVEVKDWEDAIYKSAQPLLKYEKITMAYVEKIIEISRTIGPYIVITNQVALPHAPAQHGALKTAIGFLRLKHPVISGHQYNDPVKYLFCLSAIDGKTHLTAMAQLVELLDDEQFYQILASAQMPQEILNYIQQQEEKMA